MLTEITSLQNSLVKQTFLLLQKKHRKEQQAFLLEGLKNVYEALSGNVKIRSIFIDRQKLKAEDCALLQEYSRTKDFSLYSVTAEIINKLSDAKTPQPVIAVAEQFTCKFAEINLQGKPLVLVLDGVSDPGNLGTIIRTADAAGSQAVLLNENCADLFSPKTLRSTMGSLFHLPVLYGLTDEQILSWLRQNKLQIATSRADAGTNMYKADFSKPTALVMGNEAHGISETYIAESDLSVSIPMYGRAESLNVAVATALLLYTARA